MITQEENAKEKAIFINKYLPAFTPYLDIEKLEKKVPHYRYLNDELTKLEQSKSASSIQHILSKKKLLISKNAKKLYRNSIPVK